METKIDSFSQFITKVFVLCIPLLLLVGCSASYANTPVGVTTKLFDSIQQHNIDKYLDSVSPFDRTQPGFFFYSTLIKTVAGIFDVKLDDIKIKFSDMRYEVIDINEKIAHVSVSGKMRDENFGIESDFQEYITVVKYDNKWLVTLTEEALAEAFAEPTPQIGAIGKRDLKPPATDEQKVAADALESIIINNNAAY